MNAKWQLVNALGRMVKSGTVTSQDWLKIDSAEMLPGIYTLTVYGTAPISKRFVKQ